MSAADELIARLRARAADPERRVDVRPSQFMAGVSTLDLGGLMGMLGSVSSDLRRVVAANQAGTPVDPDLHAKAVSIGAVDVDTRRDGTPGGRVRRGTRRPRGGDPGAAPAVTAAGLRGGRRRWVRAGCWVARREPGRPRRTRGCAKGSELPRGRSWPEALLPVVERDPGFTCVDCSSPDGRGRRLGSRGSRRVLGREGLREVVQRGRAVGRGVARGVGRQQDPGGAAGRDDAGRDGQGAGPVAGLLAGHDARSSARHTA